jgi:putative endonuclease
MNKQPAICIVTNKRNGTLYTGVTSDLVKRMHEHKSGLIDSFTKRYSCKMLVYYELFGSMEQAILREKEIKAGSRLKKITLIETMNSDWKDLYEIIL